MTGHISVDGTVTGHDDCAGSNHVPGCSHFAPPRRRCPVDQTPLAYPWEAGRGDAVVVSRVDARYCSPRCRQAASRHRRGVSHGWGGASDRRQRRARAAIAAAVTGQEGPQSHAAEH